MTDGSLFDIESVAPQAVTATVEPAAAQTASLYRKYRPKSFAADDLFGQDHIVTTLRNAIALNRIAHAYLFCGPRGTGKTTTARLMAKAVNCEHPDPQARPCNDCASCIAINRNATTDVIEIDAASNRGIDDIRDLRERVKYAPTQLKTKFYIIDEAHQITGAAANAFLKTLEEPPPHTKFILATTDPEELLATIVSRCQRFDFRRISLEAMSACLNKVAALESIEIDAEAIEAIARHATGSLRDGLGLLDQVSLYREHATDTHTTVTADLVRDVLGISRNERVESLVRAIADRDPAAGLNAIGAAVDDGDDIRQFAKQVLAYVRLLLLERAQGTSDADATAKALAQRFDLRELATIAQRLGDVDFRIKHAVLPQLPLELAFIDVVTATIAPTVRTDVEVTRQTVEATPPPPLQRAPSPLPPAEPEREPVPEPDLPRTSLRDRVRGQSTRPTPSRIIPAPESPAPSATPATRQPGVAASAPTRIETATASVTTSVASNNGPISLDHIVELWPQIRADVKALDRKAEAIMQQIDPVHVAGTKITMASSYEFHRNRLNSDEIRRVVEDVISRITSNQVQVTCVSREEAAELRSRVVSVGTPAPRATHTVIDEPPEPAESPGVEDTNIEDDETRINAVRNIFDADEIFEESER